MARLKKYMYQIDRTTIGFRWWWVLYKIIKYLLLSIVINLKKLKNNLSN